MNDTSLLVVDCCSSRLPLLCGNMAQAQSLVWKYFTKCDENGMEAQCSICFKTLKTGGGTTNLRQHLKNKHLKYFLEEKEQQTLENNSSPTSSAAGTSEKRTLETAIPSKFIKRIRKEKKSSGDSHIDNAIETLKGIRASLTNQSENEFSLFGKNIASQLKELPLKKAILCQSELMDVMTRHRISALENETNHLPICANGDDPVAAAIKSIGF